MFHLLGIFRERAPLRNRRHKTSENGEALKRDTWESGETGSRASVDFYRRDIEQVSPGGTHQDDLHK